MGEKAKEVLTTYGNALAVIFESIEECYDDCELGIIAEDLQRHCSFAKAKQKIINPY